MLFGKNYYFMTNGINIYLWQKEKPNKMHAISLSLLLAFSSLSLSAQTHPFLKVQNFRWYTHIHTVCAVYVRYVLVMCKYKILLKIVVEASKIYVPTYCMCAVCSILLFSGKCSFFVFFFCL